MDWIIFTEGDFSIETHSRSFANSTPCFFHQRLLRRWKDDLHFAKISNVDRNMFPATSGTKIKTRSRPVIANRLQGSPFKKDTTSTKPGAPSTVLRCCYFWYPLQLRVFEVWTWISSTSQLSVNQSCLDLKSGTYSTMFFSPPWLLLHPLLPRVSW